jgi:hypothetical protein
VKFLRATEQERLYAVRPSELQMLLIVLSSFPVLSRSQSLSKSGDEAELAEAQKLLDEAMSEHWRTMRQELEAWLQAPDRFHQAEQHLEWRVENDRREWLLQIFNNVRVGSWLELGSPDSLEDAHRTAGEESVHHVALMEMSGMFLSVLLEEPGG